MFDVAALRVLGKCITLGETHFPENMYKCFVINAPTWASMMYASIKPLMSERNRAKITISRGVPEALKAAVGGEEAIERMLKSVPEKLPVDTPPQLAPAQQPSVQSPRLAMPP